MSISVNYVWMDQFQEAPQPIPSYFFHRVQQNATMYPNAQFHVWTENPHACDPYAIPDNVSIHTLDAIPALSKISILKSANPEHIWAKVDMARLVILQHELNQPGCDAVIYTDFDVEDIKLTSEALTSRLKKYGVAFGGTLDPVSKKPIRNFENGYMAFTKAGSDLLDHIIRKATSSTKNDRNSIYAALVQALWDHSESALHLVPGIKRLMPKKLLPFSWELKVGGIHVLPPTYWRQDTGLVAMPSDRLSTKALIEPSFRATTSPAGLHS